VRPVEAREVRALLEAPVRESERCPELRLHDPRGALALRVDVIRPPTSHGRVERVRSPRGRVCRAVRVDTEEERGPGTVRDPRAGDVPDARSGGLLSRHYHREAGSLEE